MFAFFKWSPAVALLAILPVAVMAACSDDPQTDTPTVDPTPTATPTVFVRPERPTYTPTLTPSPTFAPTDTPEPEPTFTPTQLPTNTPTATLSPTPSPTDTATPSPTPTTLPTATVKPTATPTYTPTPSPTPTPAPTPTLVPTATPVDTATPSPTPTPSPTETPTVTPTQMATPEPTATFTPTPTPVPTPSGDINRPTGLAVTTGGDGEIHVSWTPPTGDVALGIAVVNQSVRWRIAGNISVKTLSATTDSYTVSGLEPATNYDVTVYAVTSAGRYTTLDPETGDEWWQTATSGGVPYTPTPITTPTATITPTPISTPTKTPTITPTSTPTKTPTVTPTRPPSTPVPAHATERRATRLSAKPGSESGQIVISWTPAKGSSTLTITGQVVSWRSADGRNFSSKSLPASATSYTISGLVSGTQYLATINTLVNNISYDALNDQGTEWFVRATAP